MKEFSLCIIFLATLQFFNSCTSEKREIKISREIRLTPLDTIKIEYGDGRLVFSDVINNKILFFNFFGKDILITDLKGVVLHRFDGTVLGANSFGSDLYGVHFQNDTSISVVSNRGYYIYNLEGKVLKKYLHPFDLSQGMYLSGEFKLSYSERQRLFISLLTTNTIAHVNQKQFYPEIKHFTVFNMDSQKYSFQIPYEPESSYLQTEYFNNMVAPYFDVSGDSLAVIYPRDPIIYLYSLRTFKKIISFNTYPDIYKHDAKFKFGVKKETKDHLLEFSNSKFFKIFLMGDTVFTSYTSGIPVEAFENINDLEDYNKLSYQYLHHYLQILVHGKKNVMDFELPKEFPRIDWISGSKIYLGQEVRWQKKKDRFLRYLVCDLKIIDNK